MVMAAEGDLKPVEGLDDRPYVPQIRDYGLEMGSAYEDHSMYALGLNVGFHLGRCLATESETCQQFADAIVDLVGREDRLNWLGLASLRWQFVNFPSPWGPFFRLFAGNRLSMVPHHDDYSTFTYGTGAGVARYLHPRVDMRFEIRAIQSEQLYSEVLISFQFKIDEWIKYFDEKLEGVTLPKLPKIPILQDE